MEQALYKLPDGWKWKKLGDLFDIGSSKRVHQKDWTTEGVPFYRAREVVLLSKNGSVDNELFISESMYQSFAAKYGLPENGDILVTGVGTLGVCYVVKENDKFYYKDGNIICLKRKSEEINSRFVEYAFQSSVLKRQVNDSAGSVVATYTISRAKSTDIPFAPVEVQNRIVEKLDALLTRIDSAIEHLQESVALADALFESSQSEIFNDVLSNYQHSTIDEICIVTSSKRIFKADYVESGIPFYRTKEIVDLSKEKNISTELFIDKEKFSEICGKFGAPKKGDLLFSAVGTIGVMWIVDEREFYFKDGNLLWLKDMNGVTPEYLKSAISAVLTEKIKDRSQGAAYKAISITNLKAFEIPLPSIEEQKSIVAKIEHVSSVTKKTKQELSLQINDLHNLKASILDSAFKGEL